VATDANGAGIFIVHGGCLADGCRGSDVWAFDVQNRVWQRLPDAPGKPRGGTTLAISGRPNRLYRFGGFNGTGQEGGQLDYLELGIDRAEWQSLMQGENNSTEKSTADKWPGHRSVAGMESITANGGKEYLVLMFGEREPSNAGHAAAGKFWDDVWAFQVSEGKWTKVDVRSVDNTSVEGPGRRGWIATAKTENGVVLWGGLDQDNQRLGDGWIFRLV
jgi:N-acetylneuraminic acid mutarotase